MKSFIKKRHEKLNEKALDSAIKKVIGPIGYYNYNIGRIDFFISEKILEENNLYDLMLPSWDDVLYEAKKTYKKFDSKDIKKIIYRLEFMNINKKICITAKDSDIKILTCFFGGLEIFDAKNVECSNDLLNNECLYPINIKADFIDFSRVCEQNNISTINLNGNSIYLYQTNLYCTNSSVSMNANFICLENSNIYDTCDIELKANCIDFDNSMIEASNAIIINNKECNELKNLKAKKIIYNGVDITNSIGKSKDIKEKINELNKVKNSITGELDINQNLCNEELSNTSISKVLKK